MITNDLNPADSLESVRSEDGGGGSATAVETVLRNDRRRDVLAYLSAQGGEADLSSLALYLAAGENETLSAIIEELHEHHLSKLASHDLLQYGPSTVRLAVDPERADTLVSRVEE